MAWVTLRESVFAIQAPNGRMLRNPELALGEAYMDGRIDFPGDSVFDFMTLVNENWRAFTTSSAGRAAVPGSAIATRRFRRTIRC